MWRPIPSLCREVNVSTEWHEVAQKEAGHYRCNLAIQPRQDFPFDCIVSTIVNRIKRVSAACDRQNFSVFPRNITSSVAGFSSM